MNNLKGSVSSTQSLSGGSAINVAVTPDITIGTVTTLEPNTSAIVELDESSTKMKPVFNFGIPKGGDYIITDEDLDEIETNIKSDIQPILEEIENTSNRAETIAKGRATGYVFNTLEELNEWLLVEENISKLVLGDNLYIRTIGVPDYWWDGTSKQVLETEKPDLTEYAKKEQFVTLLNEKEYEDLSTNGNVTREDGTTLIFNANTYYFIPEQGE